MITNLKAEDINSYIEKIYNYIEENIENIDCDLYDMLNRVCESMVDFQDKMFGLEEFTDNEIKAELLKISEIITEYSVQALSIYTNILDMNVEI